MNQLDIITTHDQAQAVSLAGQTVVVIDILRATSVMVAALNNGAAGIIPVADITSARLLKNDSRLICGERNATRIEGFDHGNSPLEFTREHIAGKEIVMTTTNGTHAVMAASKAHEVLIGAFANLKSLAGYLLQKGGQISLLCSGTQGAFSLDDFLFAGALSHILIGSRQFRPSDLAKLASFYWDHARSDIHGAMNACKHYQYLASLGYQHDLDYCFTLGGSDLVPRLIFDSGNQLFIK